MQSHIQPPEVLFEFFIPYGHRWKVYADGRYDGFPDGTCIVNYARAHLDALTGRIHRLKTALAKAEERIANYQRSDV